MLEQSIIQQLLDTSTVTSLVGTEGVYYGGRVDSAASEPWIAIWRITSTHERHQTGGSGEGRARVQIDCLGSTPKQAHNVYDAVREALDNFSGTMGSGSYTTRVDTCALLDDGQEWETPTEGSETGLCRRTMDFDVWYGESVVSN